MIKAFGIRNKDGSLMPFATAEERGVFDVPAALLEVSPEKIRKLFLDDLECTVVPVVITEVPT